MILLKNLQACAHLPIFIVIYLLTACTVEKVGTVSSFDGVTIEYESAGRGSLALVFIHGWCCDRSYWDAQVHHFSRKYRVVAIDLAGHGGSSTNRDEWSMPAYGRDIQAVVQNLNLDSIIVIGHSAGAFAALAAAKVLPEQTIGVIGADGFRFGTETYLERRFTDQQLREMAAGYPDDIADGLAATARRMFLVSSDSTLVEWVARDMSQAPREVAVPAAIAYYTYRNGGLQDALKEVGTRIPIVEIRAGDQGEVALEHVREYAPLFHVVYQYGVGHFLMMEAPDEFNRILEEQINNIIAG